MALGPLERMMLPTPSRWLDIRVRLRKRYLYLGKPYESKPPKEVNDLPKRHQLLGEDGVFEILQYLERHQQSTEFEIVVQFADQHAPEQILNILKKLRDNWLIEKVQNSLRITEDGVEAYLLLRVINGASLDSVIDRLSFGMRRRFSLITHEITGAFFKMVSGIPFPREVLICSPWIRLEAQQLGILSSLLNNGTKVSTITRPPSVLRTQDAPLGWKSQLTNTLKWLLEHRVVVVANADLHTKLYIVDAGDQSAAIFGSENLTGAGNIELGVKITDEVLINKLISYWDEIFGQSVAIDLGELS